MKNTYLELELINGDKVKLTLNFARLLKIKNEKIELYNELMRILQSKDFDVIFDSIRVLYVGYLCAYSSNDTPPLSEEEFMELVPFDLAVVNILAGALIQSKKK